MAKRVPKGLAALLLIRSLHESITIEHAFGQHALEPGAGGPATIPSRGVSKGPGRTVPGLLAGRVLFRAPAGGRPSRSSGLDAGVFRPVAGKRSPRRRRADARPISFVSTDGGGQLPQQ